MNGVAAVEAEFRSWTDKARSKPLSANTEAFHLNLYEGADTVHGNLSEPVPVTSTCSASPG